MEDRLFYVPVCQDGHFFYFLAEWKTVYFDVPVCQDGHFFYFLAEWKTAYFTSPLARTGALFLLPCRVEDRLFYVPCLPGRALFFTSLPSGRPLILRPRLPGRSSSVESCCCSLSCFCCSALSTAAAVCLHCLTWRQASSKGDDGPFLLAQGRKGRAVLGATHLLQQ